MANNRRRSRNRRHYDSGTALANGSRSNRAENYRSGYIRRDWGGDDYSDIDENQYSRRHNQGYGRRNVERAYPERSEWRNAPRPREDYGDSVRNMRRDRIIEEDRRERAYREEYRRRGRDYYEDDEQRRPSYRGRVNTGGRENYDIGRRERSAYPSDRNYTGRSRGLASSSGNWGSNLEYGNYDRGYNAGESWRGRDYDYESPRGQNRGGSLGRNYPDDRERDRHYERRQGGARDYRDYRNYDDDPRYSRHNRRDDDYNRAYGRRYEEYDDAPRYVERYGRPFADYDDE